MTQTRTYAEYAAIKALTEEYTRANDVANTLDKALTSLQDTIDYLYDLNVGVPVDEDSSIRTLEYEFVVLNDKLIAARAEVSTLGYRLAELQDGGAS